VKLAMNHLGGTERLVVHFGEQVSSEFVILPLSSEWYWHWPEFTFTASSNSTLLAIQSLGDWARFDKVVVTPLNQPPQIVQPPQGRSAFVGGSATFVAGVTGAEPLRKQWLFNGQPLSGQNASVLNLSPVTAADAGSYQFAATNLYGAVTSAPVVLTLEEPTSPAIILHPESRQALAGEYVCLLVAAIGTPPLQYQWFKHGQSLLSETNRHLIISRFSETDAGSYTVRVFSHNETVNSLPAVLSMAALTTGGGQIYFANRKFTFDGPADAPIFDVDGGTPLSGAAFMAQLYVGTTAGSLRAVAQPQPFLAGFNAGFVNTLAPPPLTLPDILPGVPAYAQVRAWDVAQGASYEEARAVGGRVGSSDILHIRTAGGDQPAPSDGLLMGLRSFSLHYGLPEYRRGRLDLVDRREDGVLVWELLGQPGARYLIDRQLDGTNWNPLRIIENPSGRVTFTDGLPNAAGTVLYRAQILE